MIIQHTTSNHPHTFFNCIYFFIFLLIQDQFWLCTTSERYESCSARHFCWRIPRTAAKTRWRWWKLNVGLLPFARWRKLNSVFVSVLVVLLTPPDTEEPETEMEKDDQTTSLHPKSHDVPGIKWAYAILCIIILQPFYNYCKGLFMFNPCSLRATYCICLRVLYIFWLMSLNDFRPSTNQQETCVLICARFF